VRRTPEPSGPRRLHELLCCLRATLILNRPAHIDSGLMIGPEFGRGLASVSEWGVMSATMITPVECRQHAVECQRMAERATNLRMQSILIDMARTWRRAKSNNSPVTRTNHCCRTIRACSSEVRRPLDPRQLLRIRIGFAGPSCRKKTVRGTTAHGVARRALDR
jgi:hypothetical protein